MSICYHKLFQECLEIIGHRRRVSISRSTPFWLGDKFLKLAPSRQLLTCYKRGDIDWDDYVNQYCREVLSGLNPQEVVQDLGDGTVML